MMLLASLKRTFHDDTPQTAHALAGPARLWLSRGRHSRRTILRNYTYDWERRWATSQSGGDGGGVSVACGMGPSNPLATVG